MGGLHPLETVPEPISTDDEVRLQPLLTILHWQTYVQGAYLARKVGEIMSQMAAIEELFATPPGDVEEQRHRSDLNWYITFFPFQPQF